MPTYNMPLRIAAIYLALGALWIAFSDRVVEMFVDDVQTLGRIQTYKGWLYVAATSALLYWITKRYKTSVELSRKQLLKSQKQYKDLVDNVDDLVASVNKDGNIVFASPKAKNLLGFEPEDIVGRNIFETLEPDSTALKNDIYPIFNKHKTFRHLNVEARRRGGSIVHLELSGTPGTHDGEFGGYCMIIRDVTRQKLARDKLVQSEALFRAVAETTSAGIFILQGDNFIYVNKAAEKVTGYTSEEILKMHFLDIVHPDHKELVRQRAVARLSGEKPPPHYEFKIISKGGDMRWVDYSGKLIQHLGSPAILGSAFDITERKRAEDEARASREELSTILSSMTDLVLVLDRDGRYLKIAPTNSPLLYKPSEELIGRSVYEILPRNQADLFTANIRASLDENTNKSLEYNLGIDGRQIWFSANISPVSENAVVWVARDITERMQIEQELRDSRETYRSVAQTASDAIITIDLHSNILFVNDAVKSIFGYGKEELVGKQITMLMPKRLRDRHMNSIQEYLATGKKHTSWHNLELPGLHKDGYEIPLEISYGEFIQHDQHFFTGIIRDISGRKTVEDALKESEEKYRKLVESANDAIFIADAETGLLLDVNKKAEELVGRSRDELVGKNQTILHPAEEVKDYLNIFKEAIKQGKAVTKDLYAQHKDGARIPIEISSSMTDLKGRKIVQGIFRDITERKQAEEALKQKDAQIRRAYVDVLSAVTGGRLVIMTEEEIEDTLGEPISDKIDISSYESLSPARATLKNTLNFYFPTIKDVDDVITATNEAITNAVKHAGSGTLQVFEETKTAQIVIADNGPGIDFSILPKATLLSGFSTKQTLGLGFNIMLEYSDRLLLSTKPGRTVVVLEINI